MSVNDLKVSTGLQDAWGQEIFLGDLVVDVKTGGGARVPYVVTKTGAANNFRINNYTSSYTKSEHVIVVTDQYVKFKGQAAHEGLLNEYPIDLIPVKKKAPSMVWCIGKEYNHHTNSRRYWVFNYVKETVKAGYKEHQVIKEQLNIKNTYIEYLHWREYSRFLRPRGFGFSSNENSVSGKKLQEWGAELGCDFTKFANQEITDPVVLAILNKV